MPERVIADVRGGSIGPTLIVTAAVHGNEPSGVDAVRAVADELVGGALGAWRGRFVGLIGNRRAYARGVRYVHEDLNRHFAPRRLERAERIVSAGHPHLAEDAELVELKRTVEKIRGEAAVEGEGAALIDLHTTSAETPPFLNIEDRDATRRIVRGVPACTVLGAEAVLEGLFADWANESGVPAVIFEAGAHGDPRSIDRHAALIRLVMGRRRMLSGDGSAAALERSSRLLREAMPGGAAGGAGSGLLEYRYRHPVREGDGFVMKPGFCNLAPIRRGDVLARWKAGEIVSPMDGLIFMPRYQNQGEDGFFIVRPISAAIDRVTLAARRAGIAGLLPFLPGVRRVPGVDGAFEVRGGGAWRRRALAACGVRRWRSLDSGVSIAARTVGALEAASRAQSVRGV